MKDMKGEVELNIPAHKAWAMYRNDQIISKINPEMLSQAQYIQGDGSPGSLRLFKLGPAIESYVKESVEKIEKVEEGRGVRYEVIGGELSKMYDPYRVSFSFNPVSGYEDTKCMAAWKVEYETLSPDTPPPHRAKEAALAFLSCFDSALHLLN